MSGGVPRYLLLVLGAVVFAALAACEPTEVPFGSESVAARNVCGGWLPETFRNQPGDACGACDHGRFVCQGESALVCVGGWVNECGGCGELEEQPGANCGVCGGAWSCSADREGLECVGGEPNACGGCVELDSEPGDICGVCGEGKWLCDVETGNLICDDPPLNACGGCGEIDGTLGASCGECGAGTMRCDESRAALQCVQAEVQLNECGGCVPLLAEVGDSCGACGVWMCSGVNGIHCQEQGMLLCGFIDDDGDGWGTEETECSCTEIGIARVGGDCDDTDPLNHPTCGNRIQECGDEVACQFVPEAVAATTIRPLGGVATNPGFRTPMITDVDVSGDGIDDLIVALPEATCADGSAECGAVIVLAGPLHETKISTPFLHSLPAGTSFASCIAAADFDGDGQNDLAVVGRDETDVNVHFFFGPLADLRLLQPDSADVVVNALRPASGESEVLSCHAISAGGGDTSLALSFDAMPYVQLVTADGRADDIDWFRGYRSRVVTDVLHTLEGDIAYVVASSSASTSVERWTNVAPFRVPMHLDSRIVVSGRSSDALRARYFQMNEGTGLITSSSDTGIGIYLPENPGWPSFADVTILGMRVLPENGWSITGGMDLNGDGHLEFTVGNPTVVTQGEIIWGTMDDYLSGWRTTIFTGDATIIRGDGSNVGFGHWVEGRGDLNADGQRDLVVLDLGGQSSSPQVSIFFARQGF